jgi:hypothetical protein
MDAPTPRQPDGKPDLSGHWIRFRGEGAFTPPELSAFRNRPPAARRLPADPNSPPIAAFWEIGANVPGGLPLTPWAAELKKQRMASNMIDNPDANCLPMGLTQFHMHGQPRKIMQNQGVIAIMYEANYGLRYIYIDGRSLPAQDSVQPFWYGYSVGRWEGATSSRDDRLRSSSRTARIRSRWVARRTGQSVLGPGEVHRAYKEADLRQAGNRHHARRPEGVHEGIDAASESTDFAGRRNHRVHLQ